MSIDIKQRNKAITDLLNGAIHSFQEIVPLQFNFSKPQLILTPLQLDFGVLIGMTGDINGSMILAGDPHLFSTIGESMFSMPIEGEMLSSFSGELGNMIAGNLASVISTNGYQLNITPPTIIQGDSVLTGFSKAIQINFQWENSDLELYFLVDM